MSNFLTNKIKEETTQAAATGAITGGAGAGIGIATAYLKPVTKQPYVKKTLKQEFIKKLKPGDILLTGSYVNKRWEKGLQSAINRNDPEYHTATYLGKNPRTGKHEYAELLLRHTAPVKPGSRKAATGKFDRVGKDMIPMLTEDSAVAYRPKFKNLQERRKFVKDVKKGYLNATYTDRTAARILAERKLGIKKMKCVGDWCSNVPAKALPKRMFDVHPSRVMPYDYRKSKHFMEVARLRTRNVHLPAATPTIKKYVLPAAVVGTVGGAAYSIYKHHQKKAELKDSPSYAWYVTKHKANIVSPMLQMGLPLKQALIHDLNKYSPAQFGPYREWFKGSKGLTGTQDPETFKKWRKAVDIHYASNPHHWKQQGLKPSDVPMKYKMESVADWYSVQKTNRPAGTKAIPFKQWYSERRTALPIDKATKHEIDLALDIKK